jgi:ABC-2 type transport system ATP-binding protein
VPLEHQIVARVGRRQHLDGEQHVVLVEVVGVLVQGDSADHADVGDEVGAPAAHGHARILRDPEVMAMTPILVARPTLSAVVHRPLYLSTAAPHPLDNPAGYRRAVMESALVLRGLVKRFDGLTAVGGVDLDVPTGSFYGLLGPNGAGKTTTLSMAVGLLRPDAGAVSVLGHDVWSDPVTAKRLLGALPDSVRMFDRLSGSELLAYVGLLRGMEPAVVEARTAELLDVLGLADAGRTLVVDYSAGMKKKIGLACALLHAPRLLVLDEPFEAVDPVSAALIRDILHRYVAGGGTVIFSSHVMEVVERLCSHVAILAGGEIKTVGTLDEVRQGRPLEDVFVSVVGGRVATGAELSWL